MQGRVTAALVAVVVMAWGGIARGNAGATQPATRPSPGNRLAYLDDPADSYYPHRDFPKLITPQWVGEENVDAVITLGIDDLRDSGKYEAYLRPILDRLKKIDGRAPVSIMSCKFDPKDPQLQVWLKEGVSLEAHTVDHPCPIWKVGDFNAVQRTYDDCIELLAKIPGNKAVAFRTPCCDSRNTPSPRIYAELMNAVTPNGHFLTIDSSVMNLTTSDDADLPRDLVLNPDGSDRFRRYVPFKNFVNTIENYPYPYLIDGAIWQFPCVTPSDWSAQNVNGKNDPRTVHDWKAALDAVVLKKGVFNLIFHPHGWIKAEQIVELIDHADKKYGKRVRFLTFKECQQRIDRHLLLDQPIRHPRTGDDNGVRILDVNNDGYMDVVIGNERIRKTRVYLPAAETWASLGTPFPVVAVTADALRSNVVSFGVLTPDGNASALTIDLVRGEPARLWRFDGDRWLADDESLTGALTQESPGRAIRFRDIDGDGICEMIAMRGASGVYRRADGWKVKTLGVENLWSRMTLRESWNGRLIDINQDGKLDLVWSDDQQVAVKLFDSFPNGWTQEVFAKRRSEDHGGVLIPPFSRSDGSNNGFFVHGRALWWQNEDTAKAPELVVRRTFDELLEYPKPQTP